MVGPVQTGGSERMRLVGNRPTRRIPESLRVLLSAAEVVGDGGLTDGEGPGHEWEGLSSC